MYKKIIKMIFQQMMCGSLLIMRVRINVPRHGNEELGDRAENFNYILRSLFMLRILFYAGVF